MHKASPRRTWGVAPREPANGHRLSVEHFPPPAPELNAGECFWVYMSGTDLANLGQVRRQVWKAAQRVRHWGELSQAFMKHTGLFRMPRYHCIMRNQ